MLRGDPDWRIRYEVASRAAASELSGLVDDEDSLVREVARSRVAVRLERGTGTSLAPLYQAAAPRLGFDAGRRTGAQRR